jgi:Reverse transcriptase (RNA-dependent DNA polymerase)
LYTQVIRRHSTRVYIAQGVTLPPYSETNILVRTENNGTCLIQNFNRTKSFNNLPYAVAPGISNILLHQPFVLRAANYGSKHIHLQKHRVMGLATAVQDDVFSISDINLERMEQKGPTIEDETWKDNLDINHLPKETQPKVKDMLSKYSSMWTGQLGEISITQHRIDLIPAAKPIYQAPYRAGVKGREVEKEEVERMLKADVIEPANSEWASPVVLITKPDGSVRFCVDYRKLNAVTVKDSYPLPRMDECLDSLGDATIFSTLDCNSGYWQILMKETDRNKTAFVTHCGVHRFKRMPFGLCNAPATFQRALDMILARVKWKTALIYLDDVIVYSRSIEERE